MYSGIVAARNSRSVEDVRTALDARTIYATRGLVAGNHHAAADLRMTNESRHDLLRLNPIAADFDLVVNASHECNLAIRQQACTIARPVEACPAVGVRDEFCAGQFLAISIAPSHSATGDANLARLARRHGRNAHRGYAPRHWDRAADGGRLGAIDSGANQPGRSEHCAFGRTVIVEEAEGETGNRIVGEARRLRLTAGEACTAATLS